MGGRGRGEQRQRPQAQSHTMHTSSYEAKLYAACVYHCLRGEMERKGEGMGGAEEREQRRQKEGDRRQGKMIDR